MSEQFYIISPELAEQIGYFEYEKSKAIDAKVGLQKDGTYLMSESVYIFFKDNYDKILSYSRDSPKVESMNRAVLTDKIDEQTAKDNLVIEVKGQKPKPIK